MEKLYENRITENRKSKRGPKMTPNFSEIGPKGGETTVEEHQKTASEAARFGCRFIKTNTYIPSIASASSCPATTKASSPN